METPVSLFIAAAGKMSLLATLGASQLIETKMLLGVLNAKVWSAQVGE
jgi:hypothetical protein